MQEDGGRGGLRGENVGVKSRDRCNIEGYGNERGDGAGYGDRRIRGRRVRGDPNGTGSHMAPESGSRADLVNDR